MVDPEWGDLAVLDLEGPDTDLEDLDMDLDLVMGLAVLDTDRDLDLGLEEVLDRDLVMGLDSVEDLDRWGLVVLDTDRDSEWVMVLDADLVMDRDLGLDLAGGRWELDRDFMDLMDRDLAGLGDMDPWSDLRADTE